MKSTFGVTLLFLMKSSCSQQEQNPCACLFLLMCLTPVVTDILFPGQHLPAKSVKYIQS